jgi:hypothetical protein
VRETTHRNELNLPAIFDMRNIRALRNFLVRLQTRLFFALLVILLLVASAVGAAAQSVTENFRAVGGDLNTAELT